ncbi:carcinoembryonic antigen-related cell adhesion molecule 16-like [Gopherus flavomarginatus]|uniref:carcinoembryonic antigen-related cell adhesion molecule 16-like n=1 Tax=Gopherus flavomarginatus TaxID=286002 RepID=UPI0021CC0445|nr:carcinoembryonic antigen-related cell adhesion molecule 16-like [Gopherus flavomarginatus]
MMGVCVLGFCLHPALGQTPVTITPPSPALGGGVSLALENLPQDVLACSWYQAATANEDSRILTHCPQTPPDSDPWPGLHIVGLKLTDTGSYTVQIQSPTNPPHEILPKPTVTLGQTQVLEDGTITLFCISSPGVDTELWLPDGASLVPSEQLGLSPDNRTLMMLGVTQDDAGAYQGEVGNPISTNRSELSTVMLASSVLGSFLQPAPAQTPVTIVLTPPSPVEGGGVSLVPQPPPQDFVLCSWYRSATAAETSRILTCFPHTPLVQQNGPAHTGLETAGPGCALHIAGLTLNDTGSYTVQIQSPTSPGLGTVVLRVYVLENGTFTLRCNSSPSADTVLWLRDGASLAPSDRLVLSPDNRTLTVLGVSRDDASTYQCEVRNPISTKRSEPNTVTVAYTPRPGLSTGAVAGIIIGALAGAVLVKAGVYFLCSGHQSKTPRQSETPPPEYENLLPAAWAGPVMLQPGQRDVYDQLQR